MNTLTESQIRAIETESRDVLVIAGAGSGKTEVLTRRVVKLLDHGASACDCMVLTFTRKAAQEMRGRIVEALGNEREVHGMLLGTFHSIALEILRANGDKLGYNTKSLTVIEPVDADLLLKQICEELQYLRGGTWTRGLSGKKVKASLERYYATGEYAFDSQDFERIHAEYKCRLHGMNALDFGSLLSECQRLLLDHPDVRKAWQGRVKHVLVDELQDANGIQHYGFLDLFAPPASFFAVGDRRQSIYAFRGSRPDLMTERHPNAELIDLQECWRCDADIVEAANRLIAHNQDPLAKPLVSMTGLEGVAWDKCGRSVDIADAVMGEHDRIEIRDHDDSDVIATGFHWSEIAVLARKHKTLKHLAEVFEESRIPYHRVGAKFDVCDSEEFRALHAMLRLLVNPRDDMAFLRIRKLLGFTDQEYAELRALAAERGQSHFETYDPCETLSIGATTLDAAIEIAFERLNLEDASVYAIIAAYWYECPTTTLTEALRWHALRDSQDDLPDDDVVTLCTVHAAKGLEWPVVFIAEMNEGNFPSSQSRKNPEELLEERRVMYVACTRAKNRLVFHWRRAEDQFLRGKQKPAAPSRFLAECGVSTAPALGESND